MSWFWMLVLWGLQGGIACAISQAKNRSGRDGFLMGALLGPIGIIIALCLPKEAPRSVWELPPEGWYPEPGNPGGQPAGGGLELVLHTIHGVDSTTVVCIIGSRWLL